MDSTEIFEAIKELIVERNDCSPGDVTLDTTWASLGIDSLDTVEMMMDLEDKIGKEIELDQKVETVGELVDFIQSKL
ncbi:MAG: acyl carrier protein [Oscillospiraceae bacterium]|nr:acyl carrier protein [Oscillospiraceae bacterium]